LYDLEMISLWECNFWMGGLAYDRQQLYAFSLSKKNQRKEKEKSN